MRGEIIVADLTELDADPSAGANIRRLVVTLRIGADQRGLRARLGRNPDGNMPIVVMVVGAHCKDALAGEKRRLAMRHLLARIR